MIEPIEIVIISDEYDNDRDEEIETFLSLGERGFKNVYPFDAYHIISPVELTEEEQEEIMMLRKKGGRFALSTGKIIEL